ncbi:MAG: hypothetical protein KA314_26615 [Chloroflexi bacterium]|nr:hypothetical protein [Chloroflexota bacterium]MBP8059424.1 hypothetical protein [Chloroflexota bacterium]
MEDQTRHDIRRLLKSFGIQTDEAIMAFINRYPGTTPLHVRLTLQDLTEYSDTPPGQPLFVEIEGEISR